jgi:hypothetical protein
MAEKRTPQSVKPVIILNVTLFVFMALCDFFLPAGKMTASFAAIILSLNGGYFISTGWMGFFPGDQQNPMGKMARSVMFGMGISCFLAGVLAAIFVVMG